MPPATQDPRRAQKERRELERLKNESVTPGAPGSRAGSVQSEGGGGGGGVGPLRTGSSAGGSARGSVGPYSVNPNNHEELACEICFAYKPYSAYSDRYPICEDCHTRPQLDIRCEDCGQMKPGRDFSIAMRKHRAPAVCTACVRAEKLDRLKDPGEKKNEVRRKRLDPLYGYASDDEGEGDDDSAPAPSSNPPPASSSSNPSNPHSHSYSNPSDLPPAAAERLADERHARAKRGEPEPRGEKRFDAAKAYGVGVSVGVGVGGAGGGAVDGQQQQEGGGGKQDAVWDYDSEDGW
ncbi:hypothetical protein JCM6882_001455 [Rhodosporidiobolus microsporus]